MFSPLSSFTLMDPVTVPPPRLFPVRAVLVATGPRPGAELSRARQIAHVNDATLSVVRLDAQLRGDRVVSTLSAAPESAYALAVVGAERSAHSRRTLAERVHDIARCAVLQVRNAGERPYEEVVIATHPTSAVAEMTAAAKFVAPTARAVTYVHAHQSAAEPQLVSQGMGLYTIRHYRQESEADARERILAVLAESGIDEGTLRLEHGPPALVLRREPPTALVVVHRRRSWIGHAITGSVTRTVLEEGRADVLIV